MHRELFIIAGANGSGKSTLASELLPEKGLEFLNADDIAREINPASIESVRIAAGKELLKRLDNLFLCGKSFAVETTLAGSNHIKTIEKAKTLNYRTSLIYTFVDNPDVCIKRIKVRVLNGGHDIPDEDVIRRYYRSKNNFWHKYKDMVDYWSIYYNGETEFIQVLKGSNADIEILSEHLYNKFHKDIE